MPTNAEKKGHCFCQGSLSLWRMTLPFLVPQIHNAERASFTEQTNMLKVEISRDCCQGCSCSEGLQGSNQSHKPQYTGQETSPCEINPD